MIRIQRWSPDTCGCALVYQYDDTVEPREYHFVSGAACSAHASLGGEELLGVVMGENRLKNFGIGAVMSRHEGLEEVGWDFDESRVLQLQTNGFLTPEEAAVEQGLLDAQFGAGRLVITA